MFDPRVFSLPLHSKRKTQKNRRSCFYKVRNVSQTFDKKVLFFPLKKQKPSKTATLLLRVPFQCANETEHQISRITPGPRLAAMKMPWALDWSFLDPAV